ncbi:MULTISPECIES: hypothetical protein [unclassified Nitratiruptor]|uniref:hypothetical protein n=1 Tax=unclassified Nitratiruptor TaxID=2624044 RepID=UPI001916C17A|nr:MULTISPECIES: hypothetical protein [unclassified Nitratiruptor]BCD60523.1 cell division transport system permease protein [Nitratiruptor sp. YY08-10]BCD63988.1 cell division transport system permease protein [Nitratiruptor sp. YY08-14]
MRSLKNHLSLIIPLFAILFAVEFYLLIERSIHSYERKLAQDYSIILVAKKPLDMENVKKKFSLIETIESIDRKQVVKRLKMRGIEVDFQSLENFLPYFYKITLRKFLSNDEVEKMKEDLLHLPEVTRVEIFSQAHHTMYQFLLFVKNITQLFLVIIVLTSGMLVFKQIEIWFLEHKERMYIMSLFGASWWMRNAVLFKLAITDTIVSVALVAGVVWYLLHTHLFQSFLGLDLTLDPNTILLKDSGWLFLIGFIVSFITIVIISLKEPSSNR